MAHADDADPGPATPSLHRERVTPELNLRLRSELERFADRATRLRWRIRARLGANYQVGRGITVGAQLATGSQDPTSAQLTLDGSFDKQPLRLDRAYFRYQPGPWFTLWAGKVPIAFENRRLIWDRDLQPEGFTEVVEHQPRGSGLSLRVALGQYLLDERSDSIRDPAVLVAQLGVAARCEVTRWAVYGAYYRYVNATGSVLDYPHSANSRTPEGILENPYHILDLLGEGAATARWFTVTGYAELAHNLAVDHRGTAVAVGVEVQPAGLPSTAGYEYRRVGRDAILDNLAESSWYRERTAFQGHKLRLSHEITPALEVATSAKVMQSLEPPVNRQFEWLVDFKWQL